MAQNYITIEIYTMIEVEMNYKYLNGKNTMMCLLIKLQILSKEKKMFH